MLTSLVNGCIIRSIDQARRQQVTKFRVKEIARQRNMTIEELAFKSGVKYSTVRNLWQGKVSNPNYSTLSAIAGALKVSIEDLVDKSDSTDVQSTGIQMPMQAARGI
jgi:transcriptional regulator with XRE-family HTH domain